LLPQEDIDGTKPTSKKSHHDMGNLYISISLSMQKSHKLRCMHGEIELDNWLQQVSQQIGRDTNRRSQIDIKE
jgi:hypothetical protein